MAARVMATLPLLAAVASAQSGGKPMSLDWNTDGGVGPDGPWNYLKLNVGSGPASTVWFYPEFGGQSTSITRSDACSNKGSTCLSPTPGYYNQNARTAKSSGDDISSSATVPGSPNYDATGTYFGWVDSVSTINGNLNASNTALAVYANLTQNAGSQKYVPLSFLSMEPTASAIKIADNDGNTVNSTTILAEYVASTGGSTTMSLHMGVASANQSGSLLLGGYDQNRLIEAPFKFGLGAVPLTGISFGTASGQTPWQNSTTPPSNFLDQYFSSSAGSGNNISLLLTPNAPYLTLPKLVCDRLHQFMPTTFDSATNLYLWNTSAPSYNDMISSPSYLSFTFGTGATAASIKVPFAALTKNLTSPLKSSPTPYFPCQPRDDEMFLGRAFLQSAFLMQSWNPQDLSKGSIYLGQAPGPGGSSSSNIQTLPAQNPDAEPAQNAPKWEDTWSQLKPLGAAANNGSSSGSADDANGKSGLSGGAIAGIVIGVLAGVALIAGAAAFFFLRKRRAARSAAGGAYAPAETSDMAQGPATGPAPTTGPVAAAAAPAVGAAAAAGGAPKHDTNGVAELQQPGAVKYGGTQQTPAASELGGSPGYGAQADHQEMDSGPQYHEMDGSIPGNPSFMPSRSTAYEMPDTSLPHEMGTNNRF